MIPPKYLKQLFAGKKIGAMPKFAFENLFFIVDSHSENSMKHVESGLATIKIQKYLCKITHFY